MSDTGRINLLDKSAWPVVHAILGDTETRVTSNPLSLGRMPEAAVYLNVQAKFTAAPAGAGYTLADVANAASTVDIVIKDTVASIVEGTVRVVGTVGGVVGSYEDVSIASGAGLHTTVALFTAISAVYSWGATVLGGGADEKIQVAWSHAFTLADVASAASVVDVTVVDTGASITTGIIRVVGTVGGVAGTIEDVNIGGGAGVYTTVALFTAISAVYSAGVRVLGGVGDETIKVEWGISGDDIVVVTDLVVGDDIVAVTNLVEPTASYKVYVQTTLDNEVTWCDIANFTFTLFSVRRLHAIKLNTALAPNITPTDGGLAANTILSGLLGNKIRLKTVAVGDYQSDAHVVVDITVR